MFQLLHVLWIKQTIVFLIKKYCFECAEWLSQASRIFWPNIVSCSLLKILAFKLGDEVIEKKKKKKSLHSCSLLQQSPTNVWLKAHLHLFHEPFLQHGSLKNTISCTESFNAKCFVCECVCVDTHTQQQYYRVSVVVLKHVGHIWI